MFTPVADRAGQGPSATLATSCARAPEPLDLSEVGRELPVAPRLVRWDALAQVDWTPDLADNIGSRRWYRGMFTMLGLMAFALAFWPDFSRLDAAPIGDLDRAATEELRAQAIAPLSRGGHSGARMGPDRAMRAVPFVPEPAELRFASTVAAGDTLATVLQRAGVAMADAHKAQALVGANLGERTLPPGTRVTLVLGPRPVPGSPRPLHHADLRARFDLALAVNRVGTGLTLEQRPIPVDTTPLRIRGRVGESLYRSARAAGAPPSAIQQYLQALDAHVSLEGDVRPDDSFDLVFAMKRAVTGETEVGDLLYAGLDRGRASIAELLRWGTDGGFYAASSFRSETYVQSGAGMLMPVNGRITSLYGQRVHPILGYARMHAGVDFGAPQGAPIVATASGVVAYAGYHGGHGRYVRLAHGGGLGTGYGHMSRIAVTAGTQVRAGDVIGYVGSTGLSTGPHLHYEMYRDGRTVNPLSAGFSTVTRQVDTRDLGAFRARLARMKSLPVGGFARGGRPTAPQLALR